MKQKKNPSQLGSRSFPYLMCTPAILLFTVFVMCPFLYGIFISLNNWNGLSDMTWNGLKNYLYTLQDKTFWLAMRHTLLYAVVVGGELLGTDIRQLRSRETAIYRIVSAHTGGKAGLVASLSEQH